MGNETVATSLANLLVDVWDEPLATLVNTHDVILEEIMAEEGEPMQIGKGLYVKRGVEISLPQGMGARQESEEYQQGVPGTVDVAYLPVRYLHMTFEVTEQAMNVLANGGQDQNGFTLEQRLASLAKSYGLDKARQGYGDRTGKLAQLNGSPSTTVTLTYNNARQGKPLFPVGMRLDVRQYHTATASVTNVTVSSVTENWIAGTGVITIGTAINGSYDDYWLFREGNANREIDGLLEIYDDGTYSATYNSLSLTNYPGWAGVVDGNSGTPRGITELLVDQVFGDIEDLGYVPDLGITWRRQWNRFKNILTAKQQFVQVEKNLKLNGGATALSYNGAPVVAGIQAPYGKFFWLCREELKWRHAKGFSRGWLDGGDPTSRNARDGSGKAAFMTKYSTTTGLPKPEKVAIWREYANLDARTRQAGGRIDDLDPSL